MRTVGTGAVLWRVRVELFAEHASEDRHGLCAASLERLLPPDDGAMLPGIGADHAVDQGIGDALAPVVGFLFWVHADSLGQAAETAVDFARGAGRDLDVGPRLYKVTVLPSDAVARPDDPFYPEPET